MSQVPNKRALPNLRDGIPFFFTDLKTIFHQLSKLRWNFFSDFRGLQDFISQLGFTFAGGKWSSPMYKFIDQDSEWPDISFWTIEIIDESFWTHIYRASDGYILEDLVCPDGKAEITEFISVLLDKNIRYFKITVDDAKIG